MPLTLATRRAGDITVIDASGRLALGQGSTALRQLLQQVTADGAKKILLSLRGVSFIDSSGLGELASGHTNTRQKGGTLKLAGLPPRVEELLQITGLCRVLDVYDNESDAIRSWDSRSSDAAGAAQ